MTCWNGNREIESSKKPSTLERRRNCNGDNKLINHVMFTSLIPSLKLCSFLFELSKQMYIFSKLLYILLLKFSLQ